MDNEDISKLSQKRTEKMIEENEEKYYKDNNLKNFSHNLFGDHIINKYFICIIDNLLHVYKDGIYINDERYIKKCMVTELPELKRFQQAEVIEYLKSVAPEREEEPTHLIPLKNGIYNIKTDELLEHSPKYIFTASYNVAYNPDAKSQVVDDTFMTVADEDLEVVQMIIEMFGYLLTKEMFLGKAFLFLGNGGNGKSLILEMMEALVGPENTSSAPLQVLSERFSVSALHHKLLNAGDDIPISSIKDAANFKKLVTGQSVEASFKGKDVFYFKNYSKLVFSANNLPRWYENSDGVFDRLIIVPFNVRIRGTEKEDKSLPKKVTTEEAKSHLLNLAIQGLRKLLKNKRITIPDVVQEQMDDFKKSNDPLYAFVSETEILNKKATDVYENYREWARFEGYKFVLNRKDFYKNMERFNFFKVRGRLPNEKNPQWIFNYKS
ncbi:phage/plasmid primase, P4 family [Staphylococcus massiliensis]|uniref:Phage/plasmid primase, P4 family, C-terminal domain protein n=1 Tax=Staphylococcus massiliensis S46 TaxID=1229783 RepID=K9AW95_9STAP|nr:phage/plasmid primase, P4 family [Staphylococcus massiliensis]EKU50341.1 phage/plasmid primase, P4 family, C-terminal domain protein [Staphylococcus massiliensis S46]